MTQTTPRTKDTGRRFSRMVFSVLLAVMVCITALPLLPVDAAESATALPLHSGRIVQYVQDSATFPLSDDQAEHIDQINYAFALIRNGEASTDHMTGLSKLEAYIKRHPHITPVLSVGGWGADGFSQACATEEGRIRLADSLLAVMDKHGFAGFDIDWEYPGMTTGGIAASENDTGNWYALLDLLREGLDEREAATGRKYILSVALGAGEDHILSVDAARLSALVDQAVVMAYDLRGFDRMTGHHAGLYPEGEMLLSAAWAVNAWIDGGFAAEKLLLGIPQYGRMWRQVTGGDGLHQRAGTSGNKVVTQPDLAQHLAGSEYTRHYDESACAPYLYNGDSFISYDDAASVQAKAEYLQANGLLGAALWEAGHDPEGILLAALHDALTPQLPQENIAE